MDTIMTKNERIHSIGSFWMWCNCEWCPIQRWINVRLLIEVNLMTIMSSDFTSAMFLNEKTKKFEPFLLQAAIFVKNWISEEPWKSFDKNCKNLMHQLNWWTSVFFYRIRVIITFTITSLNTKDLMRVKILAPSGSILESLGSITSFSLL